MYKMLLKIKEKIPALPAVDSAVNAPSQKSIGKRNEVSDFLQNIGYVKVIVCIVSLK